MSLGQNLQYLRRLRKNMTQEALAERLSVSRQTISKWELDNALPEFDKAIALCTVFHCSLDNLFREDMAKRTDAYSDLRVEEVAGFRYIPYTVVSPDPESDALDRVARLAGQYGIKIPPSSAGTSPAFRRSRSMFTICTATPPRGFCRTG